MTATFGKLEHRTLNLNPGLNVIHAPNEWGKSTWCAFLIAMLYGLDTRAKTTKNALADKERFAPWSGSPMSGRIDLCWDGRDITIERSTAGRIPLGVFRAYETVSGLEVPELNAANCGQMLLGVEQSVFRRAGFIRLSDLPITQDDALRARLNALVTTGDESGDGARLEKGLKELKNRCRHNRTGLLPQAEAQAEELETRLSELEALRAHRKKLKLRLREAEQLRRQLENHADALRYQTAQADALRVAEARDARDQAEDRLAALEVECAPLPTRQEAEEKIARLNEFLRQTHQLEAELRQSPLPPQPPRIPDPFRGMTPEEAVYTAQTDQRRCREGKAAGIPAICFGIALMLLSGGLFSFQDYLYACISFALGCLLAAAGVFRRHRRNRYRASIRHRYESADPGDWVKAAEEYRSAERQYRAADREYRAARAKLDSRLDQLKKQQATLCADADPDQMLQNWEQVRSRRLTLEAARLDAARAQKQFDVLQAMAKPAPAPASTDALNLSPEETALQLRDIQQEQQRLQARLGQYEGRMEALGSEEELTRELDQVKNRIQKLEETYAALRIAQQALTRASAQLQRRFAPRISGRAQALLARLTEGRYDRLSLGEDFTLRSATGQEDTLHDALWRSDGTIDQLYLALRIAVAEELTPNAPMILDDALVRFDEERMRSAMDLLQEIAADRQVILFTCQQREQDYLSKC